VHREGRLKIGLAFVGVMVAVLGIGVLGELYLRAQGPGLDGVGVRYLYRWHPSAGYALNAGVDHDGNIPFDSEAVHGFPTHTNAHGFRSKPVQREKRGFRVLMLGDSFTFGTGVSDEDTFSWMLSDLLTTSPGYEDAEVLNAGTNGSSNVSQVNYFWSEGIQFHPDLVVLNIYTGNDFDQNLEDAEGVTTCFRYGLYQAFTEPQDWVVRAGYLTTEDAPQFISIKPSWPQRWDESLHDRSRFYRDISDRVLSIKPFQQLLAVVGHLHIGSRKPRLINVHQTGNLSRGRRYTQEMLLLFREGLQKEGIALLVHVLPYRKEISIQGTDLGAPDHRRNTERFFQFLNRYDFAYVSDIALFESAEMASKDFYSALWGHYSPQQHWLAAQGLYRWIAEQFSRIASVDRIVAEAAIVRQAK
jgi:hypothetical protein